MFRLFQITDTETSVPGVGADGEPVCGTVKPFNGRRLKKTDCVKI